MIFQPPHKGFVKESNFTSRFGRQIKDNGGFRHKISDADIGTKPFDAICGFEGKTYGIEIKVIKGLSCHPYKLLRGSSPSMPGGQVIGLTKFAEHGKSIVIVYSRQSNTYVIVPFEDITLETKINMPC